MQNFRLLAHPWWVNLLVFVPLCAYCWFRRWKHEITSRTLLTSAVFALSFGFVEGAAAIISGRRLASYRELLARCPMSRDYPRNSSSRPSSFLICHPVCTPSKYFARLPRC